VLGVSRRFGVRDGSEVAIIDHLLRGIVGALVAVLCLPSAILCGQSEPVPQFELTFEGCPGTLSLPFETPWEREVGIHLTTSENATTQGSQGWSLGVSVTGVEPLSVTTAGTVAANETDVPPGLSRNGFNKTQLGTCGDLKGAVSAVVLSLGENVTLPPNGSALVARLTVAGVAPDEPGEFVSGRLEFQDGCRGAGMGMQNVVTWMGGSSRPEMGPPCTFFIEGFPAPRFLRGDPNDDGTVDISDSLFILGCKFLGTGCPGCRDAGDLNDDGQMDISDAVHGLNFLVSGGPSPPHPGPAACGADPTLDLLPDCVYSRC
jgi:hypothetical protein